ncbi:MAG: hypothetical protein FJZ57_06545, partial [Chlamydiae bacterium]|nr:hypothetical protein [Chlamydiota bacterium]
MGDSIVIGGAVYDFQVMSNKNRYFSSSSKTRSLSRQKLADVFVSVMRIDSFRCFYKGQFSRNANYVASRLHELALKVFTTPAWLVKDVFTLPFKKVAPSFESNIKIMDCRDIEYFTHR